MKKLAILLLFTTVALSQSNKYAGVYFTHENDMFAPNNKDENYTGSLKVDVLLPRLSFKWLPFYRFEKENNNIFQIGFGATAYTPQDLKSAVPVTYDRPYASLVFVSVGNTSYDTIRKIFVQSELYIGSIGTSIPGNAQAYIHREGWMGSTRDVPLGWDNQIGFPGSLIINYNTRIEKLITKKSKPDRTFQLAQLKWLGKLDFGNYMINLQTGVRLDFININQERLETSTSTGTFPKIFGIPSKPDKNPSTQKKAWLRFNLFAEPSVRLAAYNATLEGLLFNDHSVYKIPHSDVNRFLFEINGGANLLLWDFLFIKYAYAGRTKEFKDGKSYHNWGAATIGFAF
jgi:hypothetical protein